MDPVHKHRTRRPGGRTHIQKLRGDLNVSDVSKISQTSGDMTTKNRGFLRDYQQHRRAVTPTEIRGICLAAGLTKAAQSIQTEAPVPGQSEDRDSVHQFGKNCFQSPCLSAILATVDSQTSKMINNRQPADILRLRMAIGITFC